MLNFLLVEDDIISSKVYKNLLEKSIKCEVDTAENGICAIDYLKQKEYNVIITDIVMPNMDGWQFLDYLKKQNIATPVIVLSALNGDEDQLHGYEYEIEDYISKPINPEIFIKKIKQIIKRLYSIDNRITVIPERYTVKINNEEIILPKKEFKVFKYLFDHAGIICAKEDIHSEFWKNEDVSERVVDYTIRRIRNNLADNRGIIKTKVGVGYYYDIT